MNIQKLNKKLDILEIVIIFLFLLLAYFLFKTIYLKEDFYKEKLNSLTNVIVYGESAPRGRIYDRNYNLLVDNIAVPIIYYKKVDKITKQEEIELIYEVIDKLELEYDKLKTRNLKEFYLVLYPNKGNEKITEEEWDKQKQRVLNSSDIENLKIARITDDELNTLSETDRKAAYLYYLMNQGYSYSEKIIKSSNVTDS